MKQSTISAQVANKLLTVLQRYTKGIRFVAFLLVLFTVNIGTASAEKSIDFESGTATYSDWTFTNMTSQQSGSITAKGGSYYGTTGGKATASIQTKNQISSPKSISCYVSKQSTNTTSSTWYIQTSTNGSSWTDVKTQSATSMSKGTWVEFTADLSSYSNVYVRIYYSGSTAVRNIDNLVLTEGTTTSYDVNWKVNGETYTTGSPTISVPEGSKVTILPTEPSLDCSGKTFVGWSNQEVTDGNKPSVLFTTAENSPAINADTTFYAVFATATGSGSTTDTYDWESTSTGNWTVDNSITRTASQGVSSSYAGKINTANTYVTYTKKVAVTEFSFQFKRTSTNSNYNVYIETSTDNSNWSAAATYAMNSFSNGSYTSKSQTFDGNTELYVRFHCYNTTAVRYVDNVSITYGSSSYSDYTTSCTTETAVTLNPNGGTIDDGNWAEDNGAYTLTTEEASITLPTITRTGYTFSKWTTNEDGTGTSYNEGDAINLDGTSVTLYAQWECAMASISISGAYALTQGQEFLLTATAKDSEGNEIECPDDAIYTWQYWDGSNWQDVNDNESSDKTKLQYASCNVVDHCGKFRCIISYGDCIAYSNTNTQDDGYKVHVYHIKGFGEWSTPYPFIYDANTGEAVLTMELEAYTPYEFSIFGSSTQFFNGGTITANATDWVYGLTNYGNTKITTTIAGVYIFTLDYSEGESNNLKLDVTYPSKRIIYLEPNIWGTDPKFAVHAWGGNSTEDILMTKIDDCASRNIYYAEIDASQTNVTFIRGNTDNYDISNPWENVWNQTVDLTLGNDNLFYVDNWHDANDYNKSNGYWTTFTPNYLVTFDVQGHGTAPEDQCIAEGGTATTPTAPTATGYTFGGWYKEAGCTNAYDFSTAVTSSIPLYAKWTVNTHTLTWNVNGGNALTGTYTSGAVDYGAAITKPTDPTRTGYTFQGWHDGTSIVTPATTMPDKDLTYTAQWQICLYTLTWDLNGGTVTTAGTHAAEGATGSPSGGVEYGASITAPIVEREGYRFDGWHNGTAVVDPATTMVTTDLTYTAQWTKVYTVTFYSNGSPYEPPTDLESGDAVTFPATDPESCDTENYPHFIGWTTTTIDGSTTTQPDLVTSATVSDANLEFHAVFAAGTQCTTSTKVDVLNREFTGVSGTNYSSWSGKTATSSAVYAGQSAGGNESIQLRSNNNNSGIITTTSGGKATKVVVSWNSNTSDSRTLNVYGKNSAYEAVTDLYSTSTQGTLLGTIVCGTSTELTINGDYEYIGMRSASGAMYLNEIQITWSAGSAANYTSFITSCCQSPAVVTVTPADASLELNIDGTASTTVNISQSGGGNGRYYEPTVSPADGASLDWAALGVTYKTTAYNINFTATKAGTYTVTGNFTETSYGCQKTGSATINVVANPILQVSAEELTFTPTCGQNSASQEVEINSRYLTANSITATVATTSGSGKFTISTDNTTFETSNLTLSGGTDTKVTDQIYVRYEAEEGETGAVAGTLTLKCGSTQQVINLTGTCTCSANVTITGGPIQITAAKDIWVEAATELTITGTFLTTNANNANVSIRAYTNNAAFQIKKGGVTGEGAPKTASNNALTLNTDGAISTADWTGNIGIVYKPTQADTTETATLTVEVYRHNGSAIYSTATYELEGRSLPEQFVIAVTNGSGDWFAVPADMVAPWGNACSGLGTFAPYPISVDNPTAPTVASDVPARAVYQAAARTGNVNTNPQTMSYKSVPLGGNYYLYGSSTNVDSDGNNTNIQNASFAASEKQKWFLDVVDWNTKQYNMHVHSSLTTNVLAYTTAGGANRVGQYNATAGTTKKSIYLLPINGTTCTYYAAPVVTVMAIDATNATIQFKNDRTTAYEISLDQNTWTDLPVTLIKDCNNSEEATLLQAQLPLATYRGQTVYIRAKVTTGTACQETGSFVVPNPTIDRGETPWKYTGTAGQAFSDNSKSITISDLWNPLSVSVAEQRTNSNIQASITPEGVVTVSMAAEDATEGVHEAVLQFISDGASFVDNGKGDPQYVGVQITLHSLALQEFDGGSYAFTTTTPKVLCENLTSTYEPIIYLSHSLYKNGTAISTTSELNETNFTLIDLNTGESLSFSREGSDGGVAKITLNSTCRSNMIVGHTYRLSWENTNQVMTDQNGLPYMDCHMDFVYSENCDAPTALAACPITQTGFTANWIGDATKLNVYTKAETEALNQDITNASLNVWKKYTNDYSAKWLYGLKGDMDYNLNTTYGFQVSSTGSSWAYLYTPQIGKMLAGVTANTEIEVTIEAYCYNTANKIKCFVIDGEPTNTTFPQSGNMVTINGSSTDSWTSELLPIPAYTEVSFRVSGLTSTSRIAISALNASKTTYIKTVKISSVATSSVGTYSVTGTNYEVSNLSANTTYYYTVTDGSSNTSNEIAVTTYSGDPSLKFYSDEACTAEIDYTTVLGGEETTVYVKGSNVPACDITPIISSGYGMDYSNISYTTGTGVVSGSIILTLTDANTTEGTLTITDAEGNDYVLNIVSSDCPAGFGTMALPATNITNESAQANWRTTLDFGDDKSGTLHLYKNGVVNRELIVNGDFETGSLDAGWSNGINNGEVGAAHSFDQYTIKNSSSEAHDGNYSLYVTADGSTLNNFHGQSVMYADYITLTPGTYRMSAWVKMPTANGYDDKMQYFSLGIITGKNGSEHVYTVSTPVTVYSNNTYVQLTHEFEVTSTITACPAIGASSGTFRNFYLDDVSLVCTSIGQSDEPYLSIDIADLSDAGNLALTDLSGNTEYTYVIQNAAGCSSNPITFQTTEAGAPVITPNDVAISCQVGGSVNGIMTLTVKDVYGDIYISNSCTERITLKTTQLPKEGGVVNFTFTPLTTDEGGTTGTCIISFTTKGMSTPAEGVITWTVTAGKDPNQPNVEVVDITSTSMNIEHNQGEDNDVHIVISREKGEDEIEENLGEEIFFSKYYEAYMHKKLWAIYNPTNHPISLANTYVWRSTGDKTKDGGWNIDNGLDLSKCGNIEPGYIYPNEELIVYTSDQVGECEQSKADMTNWVAMSSSDPALSFSGNDALLLVRKDIDGDADNPPTESVELDSNGDPYELSWRQYTDEGGNKWWMLDIIGARQNNNKPDFSATTTWTWSCGDSKNEKGDAEGWVGIGEHLDPTLYTSCPYVLSTNRCLLIRKMTVKSGYKAIQNNVGNMVTLNTEWRGAHVPVSGDQSTVSCENFSFVGGYDYDGYYNAWTPIDEMGYIEATKAADGSYQISPINMPQYYCHPLRIEVYITETVGGEEIDNVKAYIDYKVPIVVDTDAETDDSEYFVTPTPENVLTPEICAECDVVIRDGAKLTHVDGGVEEFRNMQVYPTGRLKIPEGLEMQLAGLHMYAKNDEVGYAIVNNNGSSIHAEEIVHVKRIDDMYWYPFSLPYDCKVSSIYQLNGKSMGKYGSGGDWGIKYYDGQARQQAGDAYEAGETSKFWKMLGANETLKANQGYIIGLFTTEWTGQMKSIYFPPVESTEYSEGSGESKTTYISNWADNLTCEPRHRGWNFTALPYISQFSSSTGGANNNASIMMGSQGDDYATSSTVYVSIPDGGNSRTYTQVSAALATLYPFKPFFVQAIDPTDGLSHDDITLTYSKGGRTLDKLAARTASNKQTTIVVELQVANAEMSLSDNAGVLVNNRYTENYEIGADLTKMYAAAHKPQLFTRTTNNEMMAYNALPDHLAQNIPLGIYLPNTDEYTISIIDYASQLSDAEAVYLLYNGEIVANLLYADYIVQVQQAGLINGYSLDIRRKQKTTTDINNLTDGAPVITIVDGQIVIQQLPDNAEVQIIDVLGRVLYQQANVPEIITFQTPHTGVYNVVITTTEQQFTHKTIIR